MTLILQQKVIDHYQVVVTLISLPRVLSAEWANTYLETLVFRYGGVNSPVLSRLAIMFCSEAENCLVEEKI